MREWIDALSLYIEKQGKISPDQSELSEEAHQAALETDFLLHASDELETAYTSILEKAEHVNR